MEREIDCGVLPALRSIRECAFGLPTILTKVCGDLRGDCSLSSHACGGGLGQGRHIRKSSWCSIEVLTPILWPAPLILDVVQVKSFVSAQSPVRSCAKVRWRAVTSLQARTLPKAPRGCWIESKRQR